MSAKRKLAADVVGYSRLMEDDEAETLRVLNEARALFRKRVESHGTPAIASLPSSPARLKQSIVRSRFSELANRTMRIKNIIRAIVLATLAIGTSSSPTTAAERFPNRTIQIVVPFSAGSQTDILARTIGKKMMENWGKPVLVVNRPGGGGIAAANTIARASPDGHMLLVHSSGFAVAPTLYSNIPYDAVNDFSPVSQLAVVPFVVVASPSVGVRSIGDLMAAAKRNPGKMNYGSAGIGGATHLAGEQFKLAANIDVIHVPYKGTPEALIDTMAGRVQYFISPIEPALPFIRDGKLLALGVTTARRLSALPDIPTVAEAGLTDFEYTGWVGIWAPAKTPKPILNMISGEVKRILDLPDVKVHLKSQGLLPKASTPEEFSAFTRSEIGNLSRIVKASGARAE